MIMNLVLTMFTLSMILIMIMSTFSKKSKNWREKMIPFECGFNFFNSAQMPFSIRFFLIAILFIIFDVEIALILPLLTTFFSTSLKMWIFSSFALMLIILMGTLIEWKENSFEWKK
ncbi:NADH dehydrogenase subunit 3 (mitochondrion) [Frankliniella occidentalis]|uniref:NADH-ubiquinone oxidoreductase chain 3 n=1 Tax=Frankliniella occidentalis TaxID=133901 RepID=I6NC87_FRAOC|nr:NADH dehydrogenase subunit 3 [Frankliniella occidentalis]AET08373.1 NADH dehydrogenase subunit 3 [Frankliniella occidentalis]